MPTKGEIQATVSVIAILGEAIRELGEVPAGVLYAHIMPAMPSLSATTFNQLIDALVRAKLVNRSSHLLTWVGPMGPK